MKDVKKYAIKTDEHFVANEIEGILLDMDGVLIDESKSYRLAIKKLDIKQAVYLGDNIDDIKALIATNITPVGVIKESAFRKEQIRLLKGHGARYVLENVNEILEVLK